MPPQAQHTQSGRNNIAEEPPASKEPGEDVQPFNEHTTNEELREVSNLLLQGLALTTILI